MIKIYQRGINKRRRIKRINSTSAAASTVHRHAIYLAIACKKKAAGRRITTWKRLFNCQSVCSWLKFNNGESVPPDVVPYNVCACKYLQARKKVLSILFSLGSNF